MGKRMIFSLLFGCVPSNEDTAQIVFEDSAVEVDSGVEVLDTGPVYNDPWPEEEVSWENVLSAVYEGEVLSSGASLSFTSAPAGIDAATSIQITLSNRSDQEITFNPDPSAWLDADGFSWGSTPPTSLASQESITIALLFNPVTMQEEADLSMVITVPMSELSYSIGLDISVPRPLRMVLVGHNGYTLISDSYGADFFYEYIPEDIGQTMLTSTWGNGLFLRGSRLFVTEGEGGI